jgi:hypothetical protein
MSIVDRPYEESYPPSLWDGSTPDPSITSLAPNTGVAGAGPFSVGVTGARFIPTSVVEADQAAVPTTYVSATQLTAELDPQTAGSLSITVRNGGSGGEESNAVTFTVTAAEDPEPDPTGGTVRTLPGDVAYFTVAQVQAWVDEHPHLAADVLLHEQARGADARSTLVTWLQGFIESHDGEDPEA